MTSWENGDKTRIRKYLQLAPEAIELIQDRMDWLTKFDADKDTDIVGEVKTTLDELDALAVVIAADTIPGGAIVSESISVQGEFSKSVSYDSRSLATTKNARKQTELINKLARDLSIGQQANITNLYRS